jgi:hypothetical protein
MYGLEWHDFKVEEGTPSVASGCNLATPLVVMPSSSIKVASLVVQPYMHENVDEPILISFLALSLTT